MVVLVRMCSVLYISVLYAVFMSLCSNLRLSGNSGELRCVLAGYSRQRSMLLQSGYREMACKCM